MQITRSKGFALMEVLLAIFVLILVGVGIYKLFSTTSFTYKRDQIIRQVADIASAYNKLSGAGLTGSLTTSTVVPQLSNSALLPKTYFDTSGSTISIKNIHGNYVVDSISAAQVVFKVPLNSDNDDLLTGYCNEMLRYVSSCTNDKSTKSVKVTMLSGV